MPKQLFDLDAFRSQPLPTEAEIMDSWQGDLNKPVVSVLCHTFNQEMYIEDAFRGFLIQQTDFPFEVIVHDDASTDGTSDIVREYANRYPKIFKPVIQTENQYSQGKKPSLLSSAHAKGDYFALCEGDDFWIDETKLKKQYSKLQDNKNVDLCFHSAFSFDGDNLALITKYAHADSLIKVESIIEKSHGQIATASSFIRRSAFEKFINYTNDRFWLTVGDVYIHFFSSLKGGAVYIDSPMSVYRVGAVGSWTQALNPEKKIKHLISRITSYEELNEFTEYKYATSFNKSSLHTLEWTIANKQLPIKNKLILCIRYRNYFKRSWITLHFLLISFFPIYHKLYSIFKERFFRN